MEAVSNGLPRKPVSMEGILRKNSFLEDAEIFHRLLWLKDSSTALLNPQNRPAAKVPFTQIPIFSFSLL